MSYHIYKNQKKMRIGYTTGSSAAAAAWAASCALLLNKRPESVRLQTKAGPVFELAAEGLSVRDGRAECFVRKDSGDDPDVTDGVPVWVCVERITLEEYRAARGAFCMEEGGYRLLLDGGEGVGRVTGPGLEQRPGFAAINREPRRRIYESIGEICERAGYTGCLKAVVRIPAGEELSRKTFNGRLGIEGGLSILGTTGVVEPMSERALTATIEKELAYRAARGRSFLLVAPGNYGREYVRRELGLSLEEAVKCGNFIGDTIDLAVCMGLKGLLLAGDAGKLVKLAAGIFNTHSRTADGRMEVLAAHTGACGGGSALIRELLACKATGEAFRLLEEAGLREAVMSKVLKRIGAHLRRRAGDGMEIGAYLYTDGFGLLGHTEGAEALLEKIREER